MGRQILHGWHRGVWSQFGPGGFKPFRPNVRSSCNPVTQKGIEAEVVHTYSQTCMEHSRFTQSPELPELGGAIFFTFYKAGKFTWQFVSDTRRGRYVGTEHAHRHIFIRVIRNFKNHSKDNFSIREENSFEGSFSWGEFVWRKFFAFPVKGKDSKSPPWLKNSLNKNSPPNIYKDRTRVASHGALCVGFAF